MSAQVRPFTFDREFAIPVPASTTLERDHLLAELDHLRSELLRTEQRARAEGEASALARFRAERDTALLAATDALQAAVEELQQGFDRIEQEVTRESGALALAAAEHLAGRALQCDAAAAVDEAIGRVLADLRRGTPLEVRVHPDLADAIEHAVATRQSRDRRALPISVLGDASLAIGDARLLWERGGAALHALDRRESLLREIDGLLAR